MYETRTIDTLTVGDAAQFAKTIAESDIYTFAGITGDFNPAHIDAEYARQTPFKARIAHGMFGAGMISAVLGTRLPGPGTIYMSQEMKFLKPVYVGDTITARVEVTEIMEAKHRLRLRTTCLKQNGEIAIDGEALVMAPKKSRELAGTSA